MHRAKYLLIAALLALPILGWVAMAHAQSFKSGNSVTVPSGKTINNTLFAAGRTLDIAGNVNGDVFCAGENVTVSGRVNGDVICAGQNLTVSGTVTGDVRLAGQNVTLSGSVLGSATIGAQTFLQQGRSIIGRDVTLGGQDATLNGRVGRDVAGGSHTLIIGGPVGRNVQADVNHLTLNGSAKVGGNINYTSANTLAQNSGAQVTGNITRHAPTAHKQHNAFPFFSWVFAGYTYVTFILTALVLALLFPQLFEHAAVVARKGLGMTFLVGLVASIVVPIVLSIIMVTVIGIPLALLGWLVWLLLLLLAGPFAAYLLGRMILRGQRNAVLVMLVGSAILFLLYLLPFVGFLFWLVGTWFGLGAILQQVRGMRRPYHDDTTATPPVVEKPRAVP